MLSCTADSKGVSPERPFYFRQFLHSVNKYWHESANDLRKKKVRLLHSEWIRVGIQNRQLRSKPWLDLPYFGGNILQHCLNQWTYISIKNSGSEIILYISDTGKMPDSKKEKVGDPCKTRNRTLVWKIFLPDHSGDQYMPWQMRFSSHDNHCHGSGKSKYYSFRINA